MLGQPELLTIRNGIFRPNRGVKGSSWESGVVIYFEPEEFLCKCGRPNCDAVREINAGFGALLDNLRQRLDRAVVITSGLRWSYWNDWVGGDAKGGAHMRGYAADIAVESSRERFDVLRAAFESRFFHRIGVGRTFIHLDTDPTLDQNVVWLYR